MTDADDERSPRPDGEAQRRVVDDLLAWLAGAGPVSREVEIFTSPDGSEVVDLVDPGERQDVVDLWMRARAT